MPSYKVILTQDGVEMLFTSKAAAMLFCTEILYNISTVKMFKSADDRLEFYSGEELVAVMWGCYPFTDSTSNAPAAIIEWFIEVLNKSDIDMTAKANLFRHCYDKIMGEKWWRGEVTEYIVSRYHSKYFHNCDLYF